MKEITYIHPQSAAKMSAAIFSIIGVLFGMLMYLTYLISINMATIQGPEGAGTFSGDVTAQSPFSVTLILYTLALYAFAGYFMGYVGALVYNILVPRLGGVKVQIAEKARP